MTVTDIARDNTLSIVGIGYGGDVTARAADLLGRADLVVGHPDFIGQVTHLLKPDTEATDVVADAEPGQDVFALRARLAAEALASGRRAVIVTAGDPGLLGMAGPTLSALRDQAGIQDVEIVPGLSAWQYASAILGAPFNGGLITFPLCLHGESDADVARRIRSAADSGLGTCLYMLRHNGEAHPELFPTDEPAVDIALRRFAMVRNAYLAARPGDTPAVIVSDLDDERPRRVTTSLLDLNSVWGEVSDTSVLCIPGERFTAESGRLWTVT